MLAAVAKYKLKTPGEEGEEMLERLLSRVPIQYHQLLTGTLCDFPILLFFHLSHEIYGGVRDIKEIIRPDLYTMLSLKFRVVTQINDIRYTPSVFCLEEKLFLMISINDAGAYSWPGWKCNKICFYWVDDTGRGDFFEIFVRNKKVECEWVGPKGVTPFSEKGKVVRDFHNQIFVHQLVVKIYQCLPPVLGLIDFQAGEDL